MAEHISIRMSYCLFNKDGVDDDVYFILLYFLSTTDTFIIYKALQYWNTCMSLSHASIVVFYENDVTITTEPNNVSPFQK